LVCLVPKIAQSVLLGISRMAQLAVHVNLDIFLWWIATVQAALLESTLRPHPPRAPRAHLEKYL
jgi:hypothetical protein